MKPRQVRSTSLRRMCNLIKNRSIESSRIRIESESVLYLMIRAPSQSLKPFAGPLLFHLIKLLVVVIDDLIDEQPGSFNITKCSVTNRSHKVDHQGMDTSCSEKGENWLSKRQRRYGRNTISLHFTSCYYGHIHSESSHVFVHRTCAVDITLESISARKRSRVCRGSSAFLV